MKRAMVAALAGLVLAACASSTPPQLGGDSVTLPVGMLTVAGPRVMIAANGSVTLSARDDDDRVVLSDDGDCKSIAYKNVMTITRDMWSIAGRWCPGELGAS